MAPAGIGDNLEGLHAVAAAVAADRVTKLIVEKSRADREPVAGLIADARRRGAAVDVVDDVRPLAATTAPQGVVAVARPKPLAGLDDLVACASPPAVLVLDHLADPRNVGAVARSAVAAGVVAMVVGTRRSAPLGATAFKAAAGALEQMSIAAVGSIPEAIRRLSQLGLWTVGLGADGDRLLWGCELLAEPVALVVGSEGKGMSRLVRERLDTVVRVPMAPGVESLNASVAASLALFEVARMRAV
jgi:23S rRNA (guanosine2251-2'-O)-methyltransferase